jgi:hypothetical protein
MTRSEQGPMQNERFCGDRKKKIVHDLDHEKSECHIDLIITAGNADPFKDMTEARESEYLPCPYCFGFID